MTRRSLQDEDWLPAQSPPNTKVGRMPEPASVGGARSPSLDLGAAPRMRLTTRVKRFLRDHGRKVWWLHSAYALAIGTGVVVFARQGFAHARWMAVTLGIAWLLVVLVFRLYASGGEMRAFDAADARTRVRFYVMTYALKNLYQGML